MRHPFAGNLSLDAIATRPSAHATCWLVVVSLAASLLIPVLTLRGMSLDGVVYATISRNLAGNMGDFWHPVYTAPPATFYEHPPLAFALESLWFRALGDHGWVEKLYSVTTVMPSAILMVLLWRRLVGAQEPWRGYSWLSVALWVLMPAWAWIYRNNFLENTLCVFTLLAVYAVARAMTDARLSMVWTALAALAIVAAVLTKGPVGLFPLAAPLAFCVSIPNTPRWRFAMVQSGLIMSTALCLALVFSQPEPREFFAIYLRQQVFDSLQGQREIAPSSLGRFALLIGLAQDLWFTGGIACAVLYAHRRRTHRAAAPELRGAFQFFGWMALAASLPIMISPKQTAYYTAPSWPFYALALAALSCDAVHGLIEQASARKAYETWLVWLRRGAIGALAASILSLPLLSGRYLRDRELLENVERIGHVVGPHGTIEIGPSLERRWDLHAALFRWHYITVTSDCEHAEFRLDTPQTMEADRETATPHLTGLVLTRRQRVAARAPAADAH
jgi:4-amino-4-deoxy-L-arabinose transferase-like glycosyltransferase